MTIEKIIRASQDKVTMLQQHKKAYFYQTILGGMYIGFGMLLLLTLGSQLQGEPYVKLVQGATFGIALTLVLMAGADLFTGNPLLMTITYQTKHITKIQAVQATISSYIGNAIGAVIIGSLFYWSGLMHEAFQEGVIQTATLKITPSFTALLVRGILCNMLVCIAVWANFKMQTEVGRILIIFCCILPFITMGFEHSIANMTLFSVVAQLPQHNITLLNMLSNLLPVTIGNIIGGVFIALAYLSTVVTQTK